MEHESMMNGPSMKPNIRYIVTKASLNGEFQIGDRIRMEPNGDILSTDGIGWTPVKDVPNATEGWEIEINKDWYLARRYKLETELAQIMGVLHEIGL